MSRVGQGPHRDHVEGTFAWSPGPPDLVFTYRIHGTVARSNSEPGKDRGWPLHRTLDFPFSKAEGAVASPSSGGRKHTALRKGVPRSIAVIFSSREVFGKQKGPSAAGRRASDVSRGLQAAGEHKRSVVRRSRIIVYLCSGVPALFPFVLDLVSFPRFCSGLGSSRGIGR